MWIPAQQEKKTTSKQRNITKHQKKMNKQQQTAGKTPGAVDRDLDVDSC